MIAPEPAILADAVAEIERKRLAIVRQSRPFSQADLAYLDRLGRNQALLEEVIARTPF